MRSSIVVARCESRTRRHSAARSSASPAPPRRLDRAERIARRADALEIHVAREIVAAGPQRLQRRRQMRLELDEAADRRRGALAHRDAHALGLLGDARGRRCVCTRTTMRSLRSRSSRISTKPASVARRQRPLQHRMRDPRGLHRRDCKSRAIAATPSASGKPIGAMPREQWPAPRCTMSASEHRRPPGRLTVGGEIERRCRSRRRPAARAAAGRAPTSAMRPLRQQPARRGQLRRRTARAATPARAPRGIDACAAHGFGTRRRLSPVGLIGHARRPRYAQREAATA